MTRPSRISPWLCAAALSIGSLAAPALAAPFATTYTGQVSSSEYPEITAGQSYTVTFVFDNGGSTPNAQTWTAAHLTCTIWRMNNARNVVYAQDLVARPPTVVTGTAVSNAAGGLTGIFSHVTQNQPGISSGYTSTGMVLSTPVRWYANSLNGVFYSGSAQNFEDVTGGVQMTATHWTAPEPFTGSCSVISITPDNVATATVGVAYNQALSATPVVAPLTWSATGLPSGLSIDPATGVISGTPTAPTASPASVVVTVADSSAPTALTASQNLSLFVNPAPLAITTAGASPATVGQAYSQAMASTGGLAPLTWSATGLPAGLAIDPATGVISGTPTAPTASPTSVVVNVTDSSTPTALTASQTLSLVVAAVPVVAAPIPVPTLGQWALVLLSLIAAALGMGVLRHRRGASFCRKGF